MLWKCTVAHLAALPPVYAELQIFLGILNRLSINFTLRLLIWTNLLLVIFRSILLLKILPSLAIVTTIMHIIYILFFSVCFSYTKSAFDLL